LTVNQHAALLDAVYTVGPRIVCGSTLQRKANSGEQFCDELLRWDHAGGKRIQGLTNRRRAEYQLCVTP
jgi:lysozyme